MNLSRDQTHKTFISDCHEAGYPRVVPFTQWTLLGQQEEEVELQSALLAGLRHAEVELGPGGCSLRETVLSTFTTQWFQRSESRVTTEP